MFKVLLLLITFFPNLHTFKRIGKNIILLTFNFGVTPSYQVDSLTVSSSSNYCATQTVLQPFVQGWVPTTTMSDLS